MTDIVKDVSNDKTKTVTEPSFKNKRALEILIDKFLKLMNDKCLIAPYLDSSVVNFFKPENKSQFKSIRERNTTRMIDFLVNGGIRVTLICNILTFIDSSKSIKLDGDLLESKTNYGFNDSYSNAQDQKLFFEFGKDVNFKLRQKVRKCPRDQSLINLHKSPAVMASGISTIFSPSDPNDFFERLRFLIKDRQAGKNSDLIFEEIFTMVDKLFEYKCISFKQPKILLLKCLHSIKNMK